MTNSHSAAALHRATVRRLRLAERHLSAAHPVFDELIRTVGRCTLRPAPDLFQALVSTVVSQQISVKAADSIVERLRRATGRHGLGPRGLLRCSEQSLRGCGLSAAKLRTLRELAQRVSDRRLRLDRLRSQDDHAVAEALLPIPGIGPWSVQMILIFGLCRLDVLPVGDLGLRHGVSALFRMPKSLPPAQLEALAEPWRPYRTVATWYVWRSRRMKLPSDSNGD